mgnify:CR=1 FL=1
MNNILAYIEEFFTEKYELVVYADVYDLTTESKAIIEDTVPADKEAIIVGIGADNGVDAELDLKVRGKSITGSPWRTKAFPGNLRLMYIMQKVGSKEKYSLYGRGVGASVTLPVRLVVLLKKV